MRTRALGKTGLRVSELALGTWGLSGDAYGPVDEREQERVLSRALEMGVSLIDTADAYGDGRMERAVGRAVSGRGEVVVVTKGGVDRDSSPPRKRFDRAHLRAAVERSLRRLSRDRIDVYLLHNPLVETMAGAEAVDTLLELKREGASPTGASAPATSRSAGRPCARARRSSSSRTTFSTARTSTGSRAR